MYYSIEDIKASVISRKPLCAIALGRETNRERSGEIVMPAGWSFSITDTRGCGNRGFYHPTPKWTAARQQYLGWRLTALTQMGLSSQQALRCHDISHSLRWGRELEAEAVALALTAPGAVWDEDALATGRQRDEYLSRWKGVVRHAARRAGDGGISHGRQCVVIEIARAILLLP